MEKAKRHSYAYKSMISTIGIYKKQATLRFTTVLSTKFIDLIPKDVYRVDIYVDDKGIEVVPNKDGDFAICQNGSGRGLRVTIPMYLVKKYNLHNGNYKTDINENGIIHVYLTKEVNNA